MSEKRYKNGKIRKEFATEELLKEVFAHSIDYGYSIPMPFDNNTQFTTTRKGTTFAQIAGTRNNQIHPQKDGRPDLGDDELARIGQYLLFFTYVFTLETLGASYKSIKVIAKKHPLNRLILQR